MNGIASDDATMRLPENPYFFALVVVQPRQEGVDERRWPSAAQVQQKRRRRGRRSRAWPRARPSGCRWRDRATREGPSRLVDPVYLYVVVVVDNHRVGADGEARDEAREGGRRHRRLAGFETKAPTMTANPIIAQLIGLRIETKARRLKGNTTCGSSPCRPCSR